MTIYTGTHAKPGFPITTPSIAGVSVNLLCHFSTDDITVSGDVFRMCKVPANSSILSGWLYASTLDSSPQGQEEAELSIGWEGNGIEDENSSGLGNLGLVDPYNLQGYKQDSGQNFGYIYPFQEELLNGPLLFSVDTVITVTVVVKPLIMAPWSLHIAIDYAMNSEFHP